MSVNKIKPDSGLRLALQSILKNEKFKNVLVFALRSVSDFCIATNSNHVHNSLAVLDQNALPVICRICLASGHDEEMSSLCIKVLWGISVAIKKHPEIVGSDNQTKLKDKVNTESISKSISTAIAAVSKSTDYTFLQYALDALANYHEANFKLDIGVSSLFYCSILQDTDFDVFFDVF